MNTAFYSDSEGKRLLDQGPRFINVRQNQFGDYYYDNAFARKDRADANLNLCKTKRYRISPVIYRIVVRLKTVSP